MSRPTRGFSTGAAYILAIVGGAVVLLVVACGHHTSVRNRPLSQALVLEVQLKTFYPQAATPFSVSATLRNVSDAAVSFCQSDGGVSYAAHDARGELYRRPFLLHGLVLDARCHAETTLQPAEGLHFQDVVTLWADLHGEVTLLAWIRVHSVPHARVPNEWAEIRAVGTKLTVRPAA